MFLFLCFLIYVCVHALDAMYDLCVWRRLAARFMHLGSWKGVDCLASPYRLKNTGCKQEARHL
jgi:hypothetical protein